jgi:DNA polymerase I-like protein with 3'-5' exonuclease and polymerase domains
MASKLLPTLRLSFEMTNVLSNIERNGIHIDLDALDKIEAEYKDELNKLEKFLQDEAQKAMGDTLI